MKNFAHLLLATTLCAGLCAIAQEPPAAPSPAEVVPELVDAPFQTLREALNDVSDKAIEASRHARDLETELESSLVTSTVSTPEIDALRAERDKLLRQLSEAEAKLRAAILASDEFKDRAAEAAAAREEAQALATRRAAIRALFAQRRQPSPKASEQTAP